MSLSRNKIETATKADSRKLVFSGKRLQGTWIMETNLPVPVRRSALHQDVIISENRRIRTLH